MPFPEATRVIYKKSPLDTVICQLKFPPILKIGTVLPAKFQDLIREEYPLYKEKIEKPPEIPLEVLSQIPNEARELFSPLSNNKNHEFASDDECWTINLTSNFLALTTKKYDRWENFRDHLINPLTALNKVYKPSFFSRIGLRYIDIIRRSDLGVVNIPWSELLQPYVSGILSAPELKESIVPSTVSNEVIRLEDGKSYVRIVHGLVVSKDTGEVYYLIDSDFFIDSKTEIGDATKRLDYFNARGTRLIRWSITDRLHNALEPVSIV